MSPTRGHAVLISLLVTFLWSSSFILVKVGFSEINPLALVSYRYFIASCILMGYVLLYKRPSLRSFTAEKLAMFILLAIMGYVLAQGLQVFGLFYLPAITVTFILNFIPLFVLFLSVLFINERPSMLQVLGTVVTIIGVLFFFSHSDLVFDDFRGIVITLISGVGWATHMVYSRSKLKKIRENIYVFTAVPMFIASLFLMGATISTGNIVNTTFQGWVIIIWLGVVNTALAFFLWNYALQKLCAYEQCILQNTMLIQITILAIIFLDEVLTGWKLLGIIYVFFGVLIVQLTSKDNPILRGL